MKLEKSKWWWSKDINFALRNINLNWTLGCAALYNNNNNNNNNNIFFKFSKINNKKFIDTNANYLKSYLQQIRLKSYSVKTLFAIPLDEKTLNFDWKKSFN